MKFKPQVEVLAHYYLDRKYNPYTNFRKRLAVETKRIPEVGDAVIIKPKWQGMNDTKSGPGVYEVLRVLPDDKSPETFYDYSPYMSWLSLVPMNAIVVKPLVVISNKEFYESSISITEYINDYGVIVRDITIVNNETGEIREVESE